MSTDHTAPSTGSGVSRRTIVKGAAWSVPVIALAAPAPAFAASPGSTKNSLRAKFKAWQPRVNNTWMIDLIGNDPQHPAEGYFHILSTVIGQSVTGVSIFALIDRDIADNAWTPVNNVGGTYWNAPVKVGGPDGAGFYTYRLDYKTAVTNVTSAGTLVLDARFHFRAPSGGNNTRVKARWRALINPSQTPVLDVSSSNTVTLDGNGAWQYVTAPGS